MDSTSAIKFASFCATRTYISLILSLSISSVALIFNFLVDDFVIKSIKGQINLASNESEYYNAWLKPEADMKLNAYIFNVTNSESFLSDCEQLKLIEMGPYSFKIKSGRKLANSSQLEDNPTLTYLDFKKYTFDYESSASDLTDNFTTIDIPTLVINDYLSNIIVGDDITIDVVKGYLYLLGDKLFKPITAEQMLFKGKRVDLLKQLEHAWRLYYSGRPFPEVKGLKDNTFGLFNTFNVSYMGPYQIYSSGPLIGNIVSWRNSQVMNIWYGDECNHVKGTDGTFFPPFVTRGQVLTVFVPPLCRKFIFVYEKDVDLKGINLYRFKLSKDTFNSGKTTPENQCYCNETFFNHQNSSSDDFNPDCSVDGVLDLHSCMHEAPVWLSQPHFINSPLNEAQLHIEGLSADPEAHESFLDIEPYLGVPLRGRVRFQINVQLRKQTFFTGKDEVKCARLLPLAWFEYSGTVKDEDVELVIQSVVNTISRVDQSKPIYALIAFAFTVISLTLGFAKYKQNYISTLYHQMISSHPINKVNNNKDKPEIIPLESTIKQQTSEKHHRKPSISKDNQHLTAKKMIKK